MYIYKKIREIGIVLFFALFVVGCDYHDDEDDHHHHQGHTGGHNHTVYIQDNNYVTNVHIGDTQYTSYLECLNYARFATEVSYPSRTPHHSFPTYERFPTNHTCGFMMSYDTQQGKMYIGMHASSRWMTPYGLIGFDLNEKFSRWDRDAFCSEAVDVYGQAVSSVDCHTFDKSYMNSLNPGLLSERGFDPHVHDVWSLSMPLDAHFVRIWMRVSDPDDYVHKRVLDLNKVVPVDSNALGALATSCGGIIPLPGHASDLHAVCSWE